MTDKISVVVPVYKVEIFLAHCLDNLVNQTYVNLEIILVDDGSPDNCGAICDEYAHRDSRVIVLHQKNQGVSVARNVGIEKASGEWIMFVDPDDWLELDCCEKVMEIARKKTWDVVYFQSRKVDEIGRGVRLLPEIGSFEFTADQLKRMQLDMLAGDVESIGFVSSAPWGRIFRRQFLTQHQCYFPEKLARSQDIIFNLYCLEHIQRAYYLDVVCYNYRLNPQSTCNRYNMHTMEIMFQVLRESEIFVQSYHKDEEEYVRRLALKVISIQREIRNSLLFHSDRRLTYSDFCGQMQLYYDNDIVKSYIGKCCISDFKSVKQKLNYLLISGHHRFLYYVISYIYRQVTMIKIRHTIISKRKGREVI